MANYEREHSLALKTKLFYVDFTPLVAFAHGNIVTILNGNKMQLLTVS